MFKKITNYIFGFIILCLLPIGLIACNDNQANKINVPATNFMIQPIRSYLVSIRGDPPSVIHLYNPAGNIQNIDIYGRTFGGRVWQEQWLNYEDMDSFEYNIQEIEVNGISGYIATYQKKDIFLWTANVATEENGLKIIIRANTIFVNLSELLV